MKTINTKIKAKKRNKNAYTQRGITLIALIITIIVMLILAGVVLSLTIGERGIFKTAQEAAKNYTNASEKELAELDKLDNNVNEILEGLEQTGGSTEEGKIKKYLKLTGSADITTNISQTELLVNNEFTIAARVKINHQEQSTINNMDILGCHANGNGFVWEFEGTSSNLLFYTSAGKAVDYTQYYDEWTNIVMTYNNGNVKVYINNELKETFKGTLNPLGNIKIGSSYTDVFRPMKGDIQSVKIWKNELSQSEINQIDYSVKNTSIQKASTLQEINFDSIEEINSIGTMNGTDYELVPIE